MRNTVFMSILFGLLVPLTLAAQLGPDVSVYKGEQLKWEEGSRDFFVMWKSLLLNTDPSNDTSPSTGASNPQADACMDPNVGSTYTLTEDAIPMNATVERAFLVWMAGVDPSKLNAPTDNSATLSFQHSAVGELNLSQEVTASYAGTLANTSGKDFEFEGILLDSSTGISTYRVDVTDFFTQIQTKGNELGVTEPGRTLLGNYNVKGVDCTAVAAYLDTTGVLAGWSLFVIYSSESVRAKKIYVYNGLQAYRFQQQDIMISGFELPNEAEIRATLFVGEGDPGLYSATDPNLQPAPLEGLQLHGPIDTAQPWLNIFNSCNPPVSNYYEIYNSISSYYTWNAETETCVGDYVSKVMEYAMDVDTFLIKAKDEPFATHLHKDDTFFFLKIGANQDQVYTNFLILSIDTKPPSFDIPEGTVFSQNGREKDICTCAPANEPDRICDDRPYYYIIKVQNWGENLADNVTVQDTLPPEVDYIAGTTEIATAFDGNNNGTNWTLIPDNSGAFPLTTPFEVYPSMNYCDPIAMTCPDSVLVRFKVQPKAGLPKHQIVKNSASITDSTGISYQSNTSVPLTVRFSNSCPPITDCPEPPKALCGGEGGGGCTTDEQCGSCKRCDNGTCVDDSSKPGCGGELCTATRLDYRMGDMSPSNGTAKIIVPAPSAGLTMAQLAVNATCDGTNKTFSLDMLRVKFEYDSGVGITNLRLIKDVDNSGSESAGDVTIATTAALAQGYAEFAVNVSDRTMPANADNNLLIVTDAAYNGNTVPNETTFKAIIEGDAAFIAKDANGSVTNILDDPLDFATFMFEPSVGYFIFTKGPKEPAEPAKNMLNKSNPVMHIRAKSLDGENQIKSIEIERMGDSTVFGEGITTINIFEDTNSDGVGDGLPVVSASTFETPVETYTFENLNVIPAFQFTDKQERYYVVNVTFQLESGVAAQIQIPRLGVKLADSSKKIIELPIQSRIYECVSPFCYETPDPKCGCSVVADGNEPKGPLSGIILMLAALGLAGFGLRSRGRDHSV